MTTDYEHFYQKNPRGLGEPTKEITDFFIGYNKVASDVLDVGCGQGRDALFAARLGHNVTAIDLSPTGIRDLLADAKSEGMNVKGVVADIREYEWCDRYDIIVIDRTLHMLNSVDRQELLQKLLSITKIGGHILIADEPSNISIFKVIFLESKCIWSPILARKGFLFMKRQ